MLDRGPARGATGCCALAADDGMRAAGRAARLRAGRAAAARSSTRSPCSRRSGRRIRYALARGVPVRFIDLPQSRCARRRQAGRASASGRARRDPIGALAAGGRATATRSAGGRTWSSTGATTPTCSTRSPRRWRALREGRASRVTDRARRAARRTCASAIARRASRRATSGSPSSAAPGTRRRSPSCRRRKADDALLKGLPKAKVAATWVPWTYDRLVLRAAATAPASRRPAGTTTCSPRHDDVVVRWLARAARLLRDEDLDVSSAPRDRGGAPGRGARGAARPAARRAAGGRSTPPAAVARRGRRRRAGAACASSWSSASGSARCPTTTPIVPLQARPRRASSGGCGSSPRPSASRVDLDLRKATTCARSHLLHRLRAARRRLGRAAEATRRARDLPRGVGARSGSRSSRCG